MSLLRALDNALRKLARKAYLRIQRDEKRFLIELRNPKPDKPRRRLR